MLGQRSTYSYSIEDGIACIIDHDHGRSVTNDAENVISDLLKSGLNLDAMPVIYRDTAGTWDQLVVENDRFSGFRTINKESKEAAKQMALERQRSG